jgi:hypothetical protein
MSELSETESSYLHVGSILILVGGILAIVASTIRVVFTLFVGRALWGRIAGPMVLQRLGQSAPTVAGMARWVYGFMVIGAIATVVLGIIAIYAYTRVKNGKVQNGGLIAIVVGIIMLVSTHWLAGILTLVGGILCYTWRKAEPPTSSPK